MVWDGKERRKSGTREELRDRLLKLQREFEMAQTRAVKPSKQLAARKRNKPAPR